MLREYGAIKFAVYGSFAHDEAEETSNVDLLVELKEPLGLDFVGLANDIEEKLGRKVSLATFDHMQRSKKNPRMVRMIEEVERTMISV